MHKFRSNAAKSYIYFKFKECYFARCENYQFSILDNTYLQMLKCEIFRLFHLRPHKKCIKIFPWKGAPSSDAIDIDYCSNVLINGCYTNVNDDENVLKGGKGTWADTDQNNGPCTNILIENNTFGEVDLCWHWGRNLFMIEIL